MVTKWYIEFLPLFEYLKTTKIVTFGAYLAVFGPKFLKLKPKESHRKKANSIACSGRALFVT